MPRSIRRQAAYGRLRGQPRLRVLGAAEVVIRDGTLFDPINHGGAGATTTATLKSRRSPWSRSVPATCRPRPSRSATRRAPAAAATASRLRRGDRPHPDEPGFRLRHRDRHQEVHRRAAGAVHAAGLPDDRQVHPARRPRGQAYNGVEADEFVIGVVQYRTTFSSSLPPTLVRGYVQLETPANAGISQHFPLTNELLNGTTVPVLLNGVQALAVAAVARARPSQPPRTSRSGSSSITCCRRAPMATSSCPWTPRSWAPAWARWAWPTRPTWAPSWTGSGIRPAAKTRSPTCFRDNRATLSLHGGIDAVDQRRHAAPVDTAPAGRPPSVAPGRQRR